MDTYEKKYKKALEKAKESYHRFEGKTVHYDLVKLDLEDMFPELKESKDERIRKELLSWLKSKDGQTLPIDKYNAAIAWLEKQGEQKSAWSEEDEKMRQETIDWFEKKCFPYALESENPARESIKWLKSLKDRIGG